MPVVLFSALSISIHTLKRDSTLLYACGSLLTIYTMHASFHPPQVRRALFNAFNSHKRGMTATDVLEAMSSTIDEFCSA